MIDDDILIKSVQGGRAADFEHLIRRYEKKIQHFIYRMVYHPEDARNLTQETFLKVFKNIKKYRCDGKFSAFIHRVARNLAINHIKKEKRQSSFSRMFTDQSEERLLVDPQTPVQQLEETEKMNQIRGSMAQLNPSQRLALTYKFHFDYSYRQISELTGWSIPKIETLIHRAKKNLKRKIKMQEKPIQTVLDSGEM